MYEQNLNELRAAMRIKEGQKKLTHVRNTKAPFLPFTSRNPERARFQRGFTGVIGEFTRALKDYSLSEEMNREEVIESLLKKVQVNPEDRIYFEKLIDNFLFSDGDHINIFHPHMLLYLPLSEEKDSKGEKEIALFLKDVFGGETEAFESLLGKGEGGTLIANLILNQLEGLHPKESSNKYIGKLPQITELFREDLEFLTKHPDYLVENMNLFLGYYYFFYITQFTLKSNQLFKSDFTDVNKLYYILDWEGASKNRTSYMEGFQSVKESAKLLLPHYDSIEQLNYIFGTNHLIYPEFKEIYENESEEQRIEIRRLLKSWVEEYRYHSSLTPIELQDDFEELVRSLVTSLSEGGLRLGPTSRFKLSIDEIGKKYFLKTRGSLGYMLNITQDFLLLLTAITVKEERTSLKQVFQSFEERGVFLDRHSKEAVVILYDQLNLLDKKSDSGDAQYVKPIL
ncbi:hypothetical protein N781_08925 [Pontibacillus halophilus JSM 076056 = DSM 19796]|uniref:DNA phosphorothioation-dependent restriction protein DptG n=1 Tax=Pontibacillus halophilus JSM 076056 = DSM 19796 TaxID=1385510 RepID=A0A0A5GFD1_9BACI|nr:DNA phosphorothioation-dependent restriction protein DptG [Pontibacillus halophilus]KGX89830.1 hypothetical protein N781_08925 [Pontibacillus halophilus JSM 076056 = DSM 19796]